MVGLARAFSVWIAYAMNDPQSPLSKLPIAAQIASTDFAVSQRAFAQIVQSAASGTIRERAFASPIWVSAR